MEVNLIFILKEISKTWNHALQHLQVHLTSEVSFDGRVNPLKDRLRRTVTPGALSAFRHTHKVTVVLISARTSLGM